MLFYLDNWLSVGPDSPQALGIPQHPNGPYARRYGPRPNQGKRQSGLNENYGRELLELHTLSVNGGYSQRDVTESPKSLLDGLSTSHTRAGPSSLNRACMSPDQSSYWVIASSPRGEGEGLEVLHKAGDESSDCALYFVEARGNVLWRTDPPPAWSIAWRKRF